MAETLAYNFVGNDELSRVFEALDRVAGKLDRTLDSLGDNATQAGRKMGVTGYEAKGLSDKLQGAGDEADRAGRKIDDVGDEATKAGVKVAAFDLEIARLKGELRDLGTEFERTGNFDILKQFRSTQSDLGLVTRVRKEYDGIRAETHKLGSDVKKEGGLLFFALDEAAVKGMKAVGSAITNGVESGVQSAGKFAASNPWIAAAIAAGITLGVPVIGGALAAAVGAGGIATGVLLAAKDPRTKAAWGEFASEAKIELTGAASPFVDSLVRGAGRFQATLRDDIMPSVRADFLTLAPVFDHLLNGASGLITRMMPGIDALTHTAGPILNDLANELPRMGAAISDMFNSIAAGGEGGRQALHDLLVLLEATVISTGMAVEGIEKWYQAERIVVQGLTGDFKGARDAYLNLVYGINMDQAVKPVSPAVMATWRAAAAAVGAMGPTAQLTADDLKQLSGQISTTTLDANILAGQMTDKVMGAMLGMSHATLGIAESLTSLHDTIDQNGLAIDRHTGLVAMNTKAGQQNREAVLSEIEANLRQYDAMLASGASAEDAAKKYDTNTQALHDQLRAAGYTEKQVHDLIGEYGNVPSRVNTAIATQGLTAAIDGLADLIRKLNGMPTRRDIYVTEHLSTVGGFSYKSPDRLYDYPGGYAYGGRVGHMAIGGRYKVGENGPEEVVLPDDAYVIPNNQMSRGAGPQTLDAVDVPLNFRDAVTGEVIQAALLRLSKKRGYRTVAQLLPVGS